MAVETLPKCSTIAEAGIIVVLTMEEELWRIALHARQGTPRSFGAVTVHVIGFRMKDFSWTGESSVLDAQCLAEENNGPYFSAENRSDLASALRATLDCPAILKRAIAWEKASLRVCRRSRQPRRPLMALNGLSR